MVKTMCMESLEWQQEACGDIDPHFLTPYSPENRPKKQIVPDLIDADVDAFLHRMYALQQC